MYLAAWLSRAHQAKGPLYTPLKEPTGDNGDPEQDADSDGMRSRSDQFSVASVQSSTF